MHDSQQPLDFRGSLKFNFGSEVNDNSRTKSAYEEKLNGYIAIFIPLLKIGNGCVKRNVYYLENTWHFIKINKIENIGKRLFGIVYLIYIKVIKTSINQLG